MAVELIFSSWQLYLSQTTALQFDNLTVPLIVTGGMPAGYDWEALIACGDNLNVVQLTKVDGELTAELTADDLALAGIYTLQLRASSGQQVKHTSKISLSVPSSLSGDAHWPEVPTVFQQAVDTAVGAASDAAGSARDAAASERNASDSASAAADSAAFAAAMIDLDFSINESGHLVVERTVNNA